MCPNTSGPHPLPAAKMASSLHPVATHQPQCRAAGWHWRAEAPEQGAAVRQAYLGKPRFEPGEEKKGGKKREKSQTPKRGKSSCFRTAFLNSLGLQSRLEGQMADERSRLRSYSITAACLHASGAGSAQRTRGKRLALPPSPEASPPPGRTAARSRPRWEPGYFPRSFTTSKKAPG